jgi:formate-dependent nitrite reductase membrane component NrfD
LEKPERFIYILLRPQWKSWLARGAVLLIGFTIIGGAWWLFELGSYLFDYNVPILRDIFLWIGLPFAIGVAIYTAFLFAQAEGRDLWQSPLLPFHLVIQAFMAGSGLLLIIRPFLMLDERTTDVISITFGMALIIDLFITLLGEFGVPHASEIAARAAHDISYGRYKNYFWLGSIGLGHILAFLLLLLSQPIPAVFAAVCAIIGLYLFEYAFVMAPQEIPNS